MEKSNENINSIFPYNLWWEIWVVEIQDAESFLLNYPEIKLTTCGLVDTLDKHPNYLPNGVEGVGNLKTSFIAFMKMQNLVDSWLSEEVKNIIINMKQ